MMRLILIAIVSMLTLLPDWAMAQASIPLITTQPTANGGSDYSLSLQILLLMSLLTLLPAALITMTSFTRILIVLAIPSAGARHNNDPVKSNHFGPRVVSEPFHHGTRL
jgi:flagellar biosynthesis protein FliP